ncbi:uncharacterized protein EI90DRAFT_2251900 [Cantharellus anzutake]|uniref:uncharacterized protein n=1 Tax=Cantharellus anzutake TaxID=1750568 RepID=UPI0019060E76|nr:uncharacterized protein EI90DRAFT_2251900 [Cantharellus anzutake]KAF8339555.1 hypothetical protein EI90DRAFT_2251900 [Cantharellus anzutake]
MNHRFRLLLRLLLVVSLLLLVFPLVILFAPIFRVYVPCTEMVNDGDVVGKCERQLAIGGVWDFLEVGDLVINLGYVPAVGGSSAFGSSASRNGSKSGGGSPARSGSPSEVGFTRERAVRFADAIASRRSALPSGIKDKLDEVPHHHHHHHIDHRHHHQGHQHGEASDPDDPIWLIFNGSKLVPFNPRRSPPPLSPNNDPRTWSSIAKIPCPTYYSHVIGRVAGVGSASMAMIDPLHRIVIPKVQRGSSGIGTSSDDRSTWRRRKVARLNGVESEAGKLFDVVSLEGNIGGAAVSVDAEGAEFNFIELKSDVVRTRALGPARIVNRLAWIARFEVYQDDYGRDGDGRRVDLGDGWAGEWFLEAEGTPEGMKKLKGALEGKESFLWRVLLDRCVKGSVWLRLQIR